MDSGVVSKQLLLRNRTDRLVSLLILSGRVVSLLFPEESLVRFCKFPIPSGRLERLLE
jgi:hypothetical protein